MAQQTPDLPPELRPLAEMPWFKRMAARFFGHGLTRLRAQHRASWLHGQADGFRSGHTAGVEYGYKEGKLEGFEVGRQVLLIRDSRNTEHRPPSIDNHLFDDWRLPLTADLKKRIKADVARLLPGPCACGSPLRRLGPVLGRIERRVGCCPRIVRPPKGGGWQAS